MRPREHVDEGGVGRGLRLTGHEAHLQRRLTGGKVGDTQLDRISSKIQAKRPRYAKRLRHTSCIELQAQHAGPELARGDEPAQVLTALHSVPSAAAGSSHRPQAHSCLDIRMGEDGVPPGALPDVMGQSPGEA